ncbi:MAG TPA: TIGR03086 family metal-binding protein [Acidimicrobiales bacterium]|jgi:uncharacterized protein (TIGR03086 family)|nr:TIGR03086 family metal-binding protein [Acidimicrobiales bacterium]
MDEITLLDGVLAKTGDIIAGVQDDQLGLPTPCTEFDVKALMNHIIGWIQVFDAGCHGQTYEGDASAYQFGSDPAGEFRTTARHLTAGWEEYGLDRPVRVMSGDMPGEMVFNMTVMEYMAHGWDLATATGQALPFTEEESAETLARAERTLPAEYRGDDMPFGEAVEVGPDAAGSTRVAAFLGRQP